MSKETGYDQRPRFGWTDDLDLDPQIIHEVIACKKGYHPVVVIPLPFMSAKIKSKINKFTKGYIWP